MNSLRHGESFAAAARQLAGLAGLLLGWRPGEYWAATPDELAAVLEAARGEDAAAPVDGRALRAMMEAWGDG